MKHKLNDNAPVYTTIGYFSRWIKIRPDHESDKAAYEALELELSENHNVSMYSDYDAFRQAKSRFMRGTYKSSTKKPTHV